MNRHLIGNDDGTVARKRLRQARTGDNEPAQTIQPVKSVAPPPSEAVTAPNPFSPAYRRCPTFSGKTFPENNIYGSATRM